mgnify:CR=1 FL=1
MRLLRPPDGVVFLRDRAGEVGRLVVGSFQSASVSILPAVVGRLRREMKGLKKAG